MALFAITSTMPLLGSAWTGVAPGGTSAPSGTITSTTDISAMTQAVTLSLTSDELDTTNFASAGWRGKISGLAAGTIQFTFLQDFAASQIDALFGFGGTFGFGPNQTTPYYLDLKATSSARSATNPSYVCAWINTGYTMLSGSVGDLATISVQFPTTGRIGRLTS